MNVALFDRRICSFESQLDERLPAGARYIEGEQDHEQG